MFLDYLFANKNINCARKHPGADQEIFEKRGRALHKAFWLKLFMTVLPEIYKNFLKHFVTKRHLGVPGTPHLLDPPLYSDLIVF